MKLKKLPSLQFVITDQIRLLSPLNSNDRLIPLIKFILVFILLLLPLDIKAGYGEMKQRCYKSFLWSNPFKRVTHEIFDLRLFHELVSPKPQAISNYLRNSRRYSQLCFYRCFISFNIYFQISTRCAGLWFDIWFCLTVHMVWSQEPGQHCTYSGSIWSTLIYSVPTEAMSDLALWLLRNPETPRFFDCLILQANVSLGLPRNKRTVVPLFTFYLKL
jgi:hypothetical protein